MPHSIAFAREEEEGATADWLGTGLCYAALAGANPQVEKPAVEEGKDVYSTMVPTLLITPQGARRFVLRMCRTRPSPWSGAWCSIPKANS